MLDELKRLFAYDAWANGETIRALAAAGVPPAAALSRMAHVLGTEWLWLSRLRGDEKPMPVWPRLTVPDCEREAARLKGAWTDRLAGLTTDDLARHVAYVNSRGERWEGTEGDILMHTVLHSGYHRGQIASDLRAAGFEPAYTDFIHAVRQGFVE